MTTLHQRLFGMLALLLVMASLAQEPPNFARVQALPKAFNPVIAAAPNGESLVAFRLYSNDPRMLGSTPMPAHSTGLVTVARLDRAVNGVWFSGYFTGLADIRPQALAVDHLSNVVLFAYAGVATNSFEISLAGTSLFSLTNVTGQAISFLVKWNSQGEMLWAKPVGRFQYPISISTGLAIDSTNSIYVIGSADSGTNATALGCKFDHEGNLLWQVPEEGLHGLGTSLVIDQQDNLYLAGVFATNLTISGVTLTNPPFAGAPWLSHPRTFVAKVGPAGDLNWITQVSTNGYSTVRSLAIDSQTNLIVCGTSASSNLFGIPVYRGPKPDLYNATQPEGLFVAKLANVGNPQWARQVADGPGSNIGSSIGLTVAVDAEDSIYAGGAMQSWQSSTVEFGGTVLTQRGASDALLIKLSAAGEPQWAQQAGNPAEVNMGRDMVAGLVVSMDGLRAIGTFTASNATFGPLSASAGSVPTTEWDTCAFISLIPYHAPPLATELAGAELKVSWPTFPPEFELETATALGAPTLWSSNSVPVSTSNGTHSVTFPVDGSARYFRLRKPIP